LFKTITDFSAEPSILSPFSSDVHAPKRLNVSDARHVADLIYFIPDDQKAFIGAASFIVQYSQNLCSKTGPSSIYFHRLIWASNGTQVRGQSSTWFGQVNSRF
jgi:hypothetical protein